MINCVNVRAESQYAKSNRAGSIDHAACQRRASTADDVYDRWLHYRRYARHTSRRDFLLAVHVRTTADTTGVSRLVGDGVGQRALGVPRANQKNSDRSTMENRVTFARITYSLSYSARARAVRVPWL